MIVTNRNAGAIITDICTHLGSDTISGAIFMAAVPYLGPEILPKLANPTILAVVPDIMSQNDVASHKAAIVRFGKSIFFDPESIPIETRCAWLGVSLLQPPSVSSLVLVRPQVPEKLFEAGKKGLKVLFIHGNQDEQRVSGMTVVEELREHFPKPDIVGFEGSGHAFFWEKPEETNAALLAFTKKVSTQ